MVSKTGTGNGTVTSHAAGIDCGTDSNESFQDGTVVTLTATPDSGSTFSGWSGGACTGKGDCTVTMDSSKTVAASFVLPIVLDLTTGRNLISLPMEPSDTTLTTVLNGLSFDIVWAYYTDATGSWKYYKPGIFIPSGMKLTTMSPGKGYWIKITQGNGNVVW